MKLLPSCELFTGTILGAWLQHLSLRYLFYAVGADRWDPMLVMLARSLQEN